MFKSLVVPTLAAAGLVLGFSATALAVPGNSLNISTNCAVGQTGGVNIPFQDGAIGQSQGSLATGLDTCGFGAQTRAGGGGVGINATLTSDQRLFGAAPPIATAVVTAVSVVEIDLGIPVDFLTRFPSGIIPVSFSPHIEGVAFASAFSGFAGRSGNATLTATVSISGSGAIGSNTANAIAVVIASAFTDAGGGSFADSGGLPNSLPLSTIFIDPRLPIEVFFSMRAELNNVVFGDALAQAGVNAFNTLSFALSGPALDLPDGFTANSELGLIVDNVFVGQGTNANGTQVPEPGALALFGIGLVGLGVMRRRRGAAVR